LFEKLVINQFLSLFFFLEKSNKKYIVETFLCFLSTISWNLCVLLIYLKKIESLTVTVIGQFLYNRFSLCRSFILVNTFGLRSQSIQYMFVIASFIRKLPSRNFTFNKIYQQSLFHSVVPTLCVWFVRYIQQFLYLDELRYQNQKIKHSTR
jgi:hypothetical protein